MRISNQVVVIYKWFVWKQIKELFLGVVDIWFYLQYDFFLYVNCIQPK